MLIKLIAAAAQFSVKSKPLSLLVYGIYVVAIVRRSTNRSRLECGIGPIHHRTAVCGLILCDRDR